jgi:hypothetical protein
MAGNIGKAIKLARTPTGRKVISEAIRIARSDEGKKLIAQARKVAASPEGKRLLANATQLLKTPAEKGSAAARDAAAEESPLRKIIRDGFNGRKP